MKVFSSLFSSFSKTEKNFYLHVLFCAFFISVEYGITRPACNSIFLSTYSSYMFPYAWLATVPLNLLIIFFYNRCLPLLGCLRTFLVSTLFIISVNTFFAFFVHTHHFLPFLQFIWKDVYIMLMFKQMWSLVHTMVSTERAKYLYGIIMGAGGVGSVVGGLISGSLASTLGSQNLFFFTAIVYLLLYYSYSRASHYNQNYGSFQKVFQEAGVPFKVGIGLIKKSRLLFFVLLLVLFMQMSTAFVDYQFNVFLEKNIHSIDLRTEYIGKLLSITNGFSVFFQFLGTFLFLKVFGLKKSHLLVPVLLSINAFCLLLFPTFLIASTAYVLIKFLDYSFFTVIREMLYIPMSLDEKYRAKAIIDVFIYRVAKALASLVLLCVQLFLIADMTIFAGISSLFIFVCWLLVVKSMFNSYEERVVSPLTLDSLKKLSDT